MEQLIFGITSHTFFQILVTPYKIFLARIISAQVFPHGSLKSGPNIHVFDLSQVSSSLTTIILQRSLYLEVLQTSACIVKLI